LKTADVIIQTDQPSKAVKKIQMSAPTERFVWQNNILVFVKPVVFNIRASPTMCCILQMIALLAILNAAMIAENERW
jgi:Cd2+/Zn2+-exporting ATPase